MNLSLNGGRRHVSWYDIMRHIRWLKLCHFLLVADTFHEGGLSPQS